MEVAVNLLLYLRSRKDNSPYLPLLWPLCWLAGGIYLLDGYVHWILPVFLAGLMAMSAVVLPFPPVRRSRYAWAAAAFALLCLLVPVKTFFYLALCFSVFYFLEASNRKIPFAGLCALVISSPVFTYGATAFSFPLRMHLAEWVGSWLRIGQPGTLVHGAVIEQQGYEFSVDPACMGLHMLSLSLLFGLILLGWLQRKTGRYLPFFPALFYLLLVFLLNLLANLLRMVLLVQFHLLPGNFLHDLVGLLCLFLYVILPAGWMIRKFMDRWGRPYQALPFAGISFNLPLVLLSVALLVAALRLNRADSYDRFDQNAQRSVPGYRLSVFEPGIVKMENDRSLVYVKCLRGFYDTEHHPSMCWSGAGYDFSEVKTENIGGTEVFTARLQRNREKLYTAWWYEDGSSTTTSQWAWRRDQLLQGSQFVLVNLTASTESDRNREVTNFLSSKTASLLLGVPKKPLHQSAIKN